MLEYIVNVTEEYIKKFDKTQRKKIGQFFTKKDTATFMAKLFDKDELKKDLNILDPGAGSGILSAALLDYLNDYEFNSINIVMYENDENIIPLLESNCQYMIENSKNKLSIDIIKENFILDNEFNGLYNSEYEFDIIISNPPYKKISKNDHESQKMLEVVYGSPNIYFLFMAMSLHLLKTQGEMVFIVPRSWTSGKYFKSFRNYLFNNSEINNIHLFISRNNLFKGDKILQETIIIKVSKTKNTCKFIHISSSTDYTFNNLEGFDLPYELAISNDENSYLYLPTNKEEVDTLNIVNNFENTLIDVGLKLKTGLTVDFRNKDFLLEHPTPSTVPLFYSFHFNNGFIKFPIETDKKQYIIPNKNSLLQKNKNYLFLKRFTSKEEKRRLQPAIYLSECFSQYDNISTDNKINFIDTLNNEKLLLSEIYGLFVLFNSTLYDDYYRILNGSTQVNASEINSMHIPNRTILKELGNKLLISDDLSTEYCDKLLKEILK